MKYWILLIIITMGLAAPAYAQEAGLATFQETAQIVIDRSISQNVAASITLQSTSIQELKVPPELEQKLRDDGRIEAIVLTNEEQCILGVSNESCIMINVSRSPEDGGINAIQNSTRTVADGYIGMINDAFDTDARYHSVFIHSNDASNKALETSGIISGSGTVSAVYTMPMEETGSMYEKVSALLLPKEIRDGGGFYDVARNLSSHENAKMTFSLIPLDSKSLLQLKLSVNHPGAADVSRVSPLEFLDADRLERSGYFAAGFYPLNSLVQVVVLSPQDEVISGIRGDVVPTQIVGGEKIPTDVSKAGWIFDPEDGQRIQGKYIFGQETSVSSHGLEFSLGDQEPADMIGEYVIVIVITAAAAGAAIFYLRGYRRS